MPGKRQLAIAALSLALGLVAGSLAGRAQRGGGDGGEGDSGRRTLSALRKDPARQLADEIVGRLPEQLWGGARHADAWQHVASLELAEVEDLARHLARRPWLTGSESAALEMAIERWTMLDPVGVLDWIESGRQPAVVRASYWRTFRAFASRNLDAAIERVDLVPKRFRVAAMSGLALPFANSDPASAAQFYRDLGSEAHWLQNQVAEIWAKSDPLAAIEFYGRDKNLLYRIIAQWGADDTEAAIAWIGEQGFDSHQRYTFIQSISDRLLRRDPLAAMALLDEIPAGPNRNSRMTRLLRRWSRQDSAAAVAWARALEDPAARARALKQISESVSASDPELALELADSLPSAEFRNQAFERYVDARARKDPEAALEWAGGLEDEDRRRTAITSSVAGLATKDLARATDIIVSTPDKSHKKEMFAKIIKDDNIGRDQIGTAREVIAKLSREDEKLAVETILEVNGEYLPKPVKALLKLSGDLGKFLDWAERFERGPFAD